MSFQWVDVINKDLRYFPTTQGLKTFFLIFQAPNHSRKTHQHQEHVFFWENILELLFPTHEYFSARFAASFSPAKSQQQL